MTNAQEYFIIILLNETQGECGMEYYEKYADVEKYCYFVEANEPSIAGMVHEIACHPHFHKNVEFLFITKGTQHAMIGGEKIVAEAGDILYVDTFEPHSFADDEGVEGYILVVSLWYLNCFQKLFENQRFPRVMRDKEKNAEIISFIRSWKEQYRKGCYQEDAYEIFVNSNRLFLMIKKAYGTFRRQKNNNQSVVLEILTYLEKNYREKVTIKEIAQTLGYTKEYCSQVFNYYMGESFRSYLNRIRVYKFQELYSERSASTSIIHLAFECGFDSQSTFYRAYKEVFGMNPKEQKKIN